MTNPTPACLLVANDVAPGAGAAFDAWYQGQHLDERLAVPGFREARRYRAIAASHRWAALYDVASLAVFGSPAYARCLANPTDWTKQVMPSFRRMVRSLLAVAADEGAGTGMLLDIVVPDSSADPSASVDAFPWRAHPAFERLRVLRADPSAPTPASAAVESALRPGADASWRTVVLVEWAGLSGRHAPPPPAAVAAALGGAGTRGGEHAGGRYRLATIRRPRPAGADRASPVQ